MNEPPFSISTSYPLDEGGLSYLLHIDQTGLATLTLESNVETPQLQAIGVFQDDIGYDKALGFKNMFATLSKISLPAGDPALPTAPMVHVTLQEEGVSESRIIDPTTSPPAMCKVAEHLKEVGNELLQHPLQVVQMKVGLGQVRMKRSDKLNLSIRLDAEGSKAVKFADPLKAAQKESGGFILWGVRSDLAPADLWPQHSKHQVIRPSELFQVDLPVQKSGNGVLELLPGQQANYTFNIPLDWEAGEYAVKIIFETTSDKEGILRGNIISLPVTLTVQQ